MIKLDLVPSSIKPVLHASQYDDGRQWECQILNDGTPYVFKEGDTVDYTIRKGDGLLVTGAVAVTPGSSTITLVSTEQMCAVFGSNLGELTITSNGTKVGSVNFIIEVERAPDENGITSQSEIKNLNRQITEEVDRILPDKIAEEVPPAIRELAPPIITEIAETTVNEIASPIVERLVPEVVGDNYYNKEQTDTKIVELINDGSTANNTAWSSSKINTELGTKTNITDFKTKTGVIDDNIVSILYEGKLNDGNVGYKKGGVNLTTGEYINPTSKKSMVDKDFEPIELKSDVIKLHIASGYKTRGVILTPSKVYETYIGEWSTGGTVAALQNKKGYYVMLAIEKVDGSDISDTELANASESTLYLEAVLEVDNGIIGDINTLKTSNGILTGDVSGLKTKTTDLKTGTDVINQNIYSMLYNGNLNDGNVGYKKGGVNLNTGAFINPTSKKSMVERNFEPIELKSDTIILHIANGYKTRGVILKPDKSFDSNFTGWSTGGTVDALQNKKGYYAMLAVEKVDGSDITDLELSSASESTLYLEAVFGFSGGILGELPKINKPFLGKNIVNFGDSLFGNFRDDNVTTHKSISKMISENTGATVYNAGFGGCRMGERLVGAAYWNAFSMYALADSVVSGNWSVQDQALLDGAGTLPDYFDDTVAMLKTIDFSKVDIITISYGTNDYTGDIPLTGVGVEYQNYEGALKYSLRKILNKYPSMRIVVLSPAWRFWYSGGAYSYSSDDAQSANNNGDMLTDYVAKCDDVCKEYHIPYVDMYYKLGFNQYSYTAYFSDIDSTHPIQIGRQLMADRISGQLRALLDH